MDSRAQSETIGVILLTAVVVIVVGAAGTIVLADAAGEDTTRTDVSITITDEGIGLSHSGGDPVPFSDLRVVVRNANGTWRPAMNESGIVDGNTNGVFEPGERWTARHGLGLENVTTVQIFDQRTETLLAEARRYPTRRVSLTDTEPSTATDSTSTETAAPEPALDTEPPDVTVQSVNDGEAIRGETSASIRWTASDPGSGVRGVDIAYSADNGNTWNTVATNVANTGSYDWTIPNIDSSDVRVRVRATDAAGNTAADVSDPPITVRSSGLSALRVSDITSSEGDQSQIVSFTVTGSLQDGETVTIDLSDAQDVQGGGQGQGGNQGQGRGQAQGGNQGQGGGQGQGGQINQVDYRSASISGSGSAEFTTRNRNDAVITFTAQRDIAPTETISFTISGVKTADGYTAQHSVTFDRSDAPESATKSFKVRLSGGSTISGTRDGDVFVDGNLTVDNDASVTGNISATGSVTIRDRGSVSGDVETVGGLDLGNNVMISGNLSSWEGMMIGRGASISGDVVSDDRLVIGNEGEISGNVSSGVSVTLGDRTNVDGSVSSGGNLTVGSEGEVDGDLSSRGATTLGDRSVIRGNVSTDTVDVGAEAEVTGDVFVDSADHIQCGPQSTINGQDCETYVDENY